MARLDSNLHESIKEDIINLLFSKKIYTTIDFLEADNKYIKNITPLSYKDILEIKELITHKYSATIQTGAELYEDFIKNTKILPTFIHSIDAILNGGLIHDNIYELCGYASSGKTQLCLTLAINFAQYLEKSVLYIDTKRDFSGKRLQNILNERNCSVETLAKICNDIKIKQINNRFELITTLNEIKDVNSSISNVKLVIIDSLPAIFYHTGELNSSLIIMNLFVNIMRYLGTEKKICFVITNILLQNQGLVTNEPSLNTEKPGLGSYWNTIPHCRFKLSKLNNCCDITLIKCTNLPNRSCQVQITNSGVF